MLSGTSLPSGAFILAATFTLPSLEKSTVAPGGSSPLVASHVPTIFSLFDPPPLESLPSLPPPSPPLVVADLPQPTTASTKKPSTRAAFTRFIGASTQTEYRLAPTPGEDVL